MKNGKKELLLNILSFPNVFSGNLNRLGIYKDEVPDYNSRGRQHFIKAFTLIELLVVVLIIGILAAIALPQYEKAVEKAKAAQAMTMMSSIVDAVKVYYLANGTYPSKFEELDVQVPFTRDTHTYTYSASIDHPDWKSTDDWNIMIYKWTNSSYGYGIQFMRTSGKYKGAGFAYFFHRSLGDAPLGQLFCMEAPNAGFTGESGRYCRKVIGGTRYKNGWAYTLP